MRRNDRENPARGDGANRRRGIESGYGREERRSGNRGRRADTEKKTAEATVPRTAAGMIVAEAAAPRTAAAKSAVHMHVRKEQRLPVMHRLKSSRRIAVS